MKKLVSIEKSIISITTQNPKSTEAKTFLKMLDFWEYYDELFHTNHSKVLRIVYSTTESSKTNVYKALKANVGENTLIRYRKLYLDAYNIILYRQTLLANKPL